MKNALFIYWKNAIMELITFVFHKAIAKHSVKIVLKKLHKNLVFRPVDKDANKVAVIYQKV